MTNPFNADLVEAVRNLYVGNAAARGLFDKLAVRERSPTITTLDRMSQMLGVSRGEAVSLARELGEAGCGRFLVGRRGQKSRFEWKYRCVDLARTAAGEGDEVELTDPAEGDVIDDVVRDDVDEGITIGRAKELLSYSLGVPASAIEILIRA